jgi:hypothetical protein
MSGYDWAAGKSNNAVAAEANGKMPASHLAKRIKRHKRFRGCTAGDIARTMDACEWHHSSKFYNQVYYYDFRDLWYTDIRDKLAEEIAARKEYKKLQKQAQKAGMTWFTMPDGGQWYPIPTKWGSGFGCARRTCLARLRDQLAYGRVRQETVDVC